MGSTVIWLTSLYELKIMATKYHVGLAALVAQVTTVTFSAVTIGVTYSITINGKSVTFTATDTLQATLTTALMNAWNTSASSEHQELIATGGVTSVILTARVAGVPHTITASTSGAPTATVAATVAASGPSFAFGVAANWSGGTVPSAGDDLIFNGTHEIVYGLTSATDYNSITIKAGCGPIGLPFSNPKGYPEYRTRFLTTGTATNPITLKIGQGTGLQPSRIYLDLAEQLVTASIYSSSNSGSGSLPIQIKNVGTSSVVAVYGGTVDFQNDSALTISSFSQVPSSQQSPNSSIGSNVDITMATVGGGTCSIEGNVGTLHSSSSAIVSISSSGTVDNLFVQQNGQVRWKSSGDIGTEASVYGDGTLDFSEDGESVEVPSLQMFSGSSLKDPLGRVTYTSGIVLNGCKVSDVKIDVGFSRTIGVS